MLARKLLGAGGLVGGGGGPSDGDVTITMTGTDEVLGWYIRISGADTTSPIDVKNFQDYLGAGSSHDIEGVTTTVNNCLAFYGIAFDGGDGSPFGQPTGWTEQGDAASGTDSADASAAWGTKSMASAGATGTAVVSNSSYDGASGFQLAIAPSGGSVPVIEAIQLSDSDGDAVTELTLTAPAGITIGELLMIIIACDKASYGDAFEALTGWTKEEEAFSTNGDASIAVYWKEAE
jgi:hypothetical protein